MKKLITVSPIIMLIIPVLLFLGLSLAVENKQDQEETLSTTTIVSSSTIVKAGKISLIKYFLK